MPLIDGFVVIGAAGVILLGILGIRALRRRVQPEIAGSENAHEVMEQKRRRCYFCRKHTEARGEPTDAVDPALKWVADNQRALQEHARKYVAFTPTEGVITAAASLKEVYAKLGDRVRNVSIHFVAEAQSLSDDVLKTGSEIGKCHDGA